MNRDAHLVTWKVDRCGRNLTAIRHRLIAVETRITTSREAPSEPSKSVLAKFFFDRFAGATITTVGIRKQPLRYFIGRLFIRLEQIVLASYYHDSAQPFECEDVKAALHNGEVRAYDRKREFGTSPSGADGGNRTGALEPQRKPGTDPD